MADPLTVGLVTGLGLLGTATSYSQARSQNQAIRRSQDSTRQAAEINARQVKQASEVEIQKERQRMNRVRAILRTQAAEAGGSLDDGSYGALGRQASIDNEFNRTIAQINASNQIGSIASGMRANLINLDSRRKDSLLDAFTGGLAGVGTGLSLNTSISQLRAS